MTNLTALLHETVANAPTRPVVQTLRNGEHADDPPLSYEQLDRSSRRLAAHLSTRCAVGARVGIVQPRAEDFLVSFFACQRAGLIAVPLPSPGRRQARSAPFFRFLADCGAGIVLSHSSLEARLRPATSERVLINTDVFAAGMDTASPMPELPDLDQRTDAIAYLQYTSGSTGDPKAVCITHGNVLANLAQITDRLRLSDGLAVVSWLPSYHDQGLVGALLLTVFNAGVCVSMSPTAFVQRPLRWLEAISDFGASLSGAPNFAFELCTRALVEGRPHKDMRLDQWRIAFNGAEPVRAATLERFSEAFARFGFRRSHFFPSYGLAEATLAVTLPVPRTQPSWRTLARETSEVVTCGEPVAGTTVRIVDPVTCRVAEAGGIGEIWVSGPSIATNYWGDIQRSTSRLRAALEPPDGLSYLRTGDLGVLVENELVVLSRRDDMMIVRGRNHFPADIEATVEAAAVGVPISSVAVFSAEDAQDAHVAIELAGLVPDDEDLASIATRVAASIVRDHAIAVARVLFVPRGKLPKTTSGKVQRDRCRRLAASGEMPLAYAHDLNAGDARLTKETEDAIGETRRLRQLIESVFPDRSTGREFFWDSLEATRVQHAIQSTFGIMLDVAVFEPPVTIDRLARAIGTVSDAQTTSTGVDADESDACLTAFQRDIWVACQHETECVRYNIGFALSFDGAFEAGRLESAWQRICGRHPILMTRISCDAAETTGPMPAIDRIGVDNSGADHASIDRLGPSLRRDLADAWFARPFALAGGPLCRLGVFAEESTEGWHLLFAVHHIIADHWSLRCLARDLAVAYRSAADRLPPTTAHRSFADWHRRQMARHDAELADFWRARLRGYVRHVTLTRMPRRSLSNLEVASASRVLSREVTRRLDGISRRTGFGFTALFLAAYATLIARYGGCDDVVVGCPTALRDRRDDADTFGYLINTVPLRLSIAGTDRLRSIWEQAQGVLLDARAHSLFPSSRISSEPRLVAEDGVSPLNALLFNVTDERDGAWGPGGASALPGDARVAWVHSPHPRVDLRLSVHRRDASVDIELTAFAGRYDKPFLEGFAANLVQVVGQLISTAHLDTRVDDLDIGAAAPTHAILPGPSPTALAGGADRLDVAIAAAVARFPDRTALRWRDGDGWRTLTYIELDRRSALVADEVAGRHDGVIALFMRRSAEAIIAIVAILRAGAAYLPIDPDLPDARVETYLLDSGCRLVLADDETVSRIDPARWQVWVPGSGACAGAAKPHAPENAVAALIYTSGSTGRPKGVLVPHSAYLARLRAMSDELTIRPDDVFIQKASLSFDVSVWEIFLPLLNGASLVVPRGWEVRDPWLLGRLMTEAAVSIAHFVPTLLHEFLRHARGRPATSLRACLCSGEPLRAEHAALFMQRFGNTQLVNLYGPTECAIDVTMHRLADTERDPAIGAPTKDVRAYVLDEKLRALPVGVAGQLGIAGPQLAYGYHGRGDLTAEAFVPSPFGDGERLYLTGDLVRRDGDGDLWFLGRVDRQVKLYGVRIELDEVRAVLCRHAAVQDAEVLLVGDDAGVELAALVVGESDIPAAELAAHLARYLAAAFVPKRFVCVRRFPVLPNGKRDAATISRLLATPMPEPPSVAPDPSLSALVGRAWLAALGAVPTDDSNFFDVGGDSLRAIRLVAALRRSGLDIGLADIFKAPTIDAQRRFLAARPLAAEPVRYVPFSLVGPGREALLGDPAIEDAYPLSMLQRAVVFQSEHEARYELYLSHIRIAGCFREEALRLAIDRLLDRHAFLRSRFALTQASEPLQIVLRRANPTLDVHDWRLRSKSRIDADLEAWRTAEKALRFDWHAAPLVRFAVHRIDDEDFILHMTDVALDGWCIATILTELAQDYDARVGGTASPVRPELPSYGRFVAAEQASLRCPESRLFWAQRVAGALPQSVARWGPSIDGEGRRQVELRIDDAAGRGIERIARSEHVPVKTLFLAVHVVLRAVLTSVDRVIAPVEVNGRLEEMGDDAVVGVFNNIVPVVVDLAGLTWRDALGDLLTAEIAGLPHRRFPFAEIQRQAGCRQFADSLFVFTDFHVLDALDDLRHIRVSDVGATDQTYFPLTFHVDHSRRDGAFRLLLAYAGDAFDAAQIDWIGRTFLDLCGALPTLLNTPCRQTIEPLRIAAVRRGWAARGGSSLDRFLAHAAGTPSMIAMHEDERSLTYQAAARAAMARAAALSAQGVAAGDRIAIVAPAGIDLVVALLGAWHVGAACLLIDPDDLPSRIVDKIVRAGVSVALTCDTPPWSAELPGVAIAPLRVPVRHGPTIVEGVPLDQAQDAYLLYTSGSTGVAKAVVMGHAALANYAAWSAARYGMAPGDIVWSHGSAAFDATITTMLVPLTAGCTIRFVEKGDLSSVLAAATPRDILKITPAHLPLIMALACNHHQTVLPARLIIGGEPLYGRDVALLKSLDPDVRIFNEYGPTEACVGASACLCGQVDPASPCAIGGAIDNAAIHVLDADLAGIDAGRSGEIYIGGIGLAHGYDGDAALTAQRFVPDPFASAPGARMYRSGDRAARLDGALICLGRVDRQVKRFGYRFELGEIESVLNTCRGVAAAAAVMNCGRPRAWVVPSAKDFSAECLDRWVEQRLPWYMRPDIALVDGLPLTSTGKIDHAALEGREPATPIPADETLLDWVEQLDDDEASRILAEQCGAARDA